MPKKVTVIIPVYNEEQTIEKVISGIRALNKDYELIVVDDGSTDQTPAILKNLNIKTISHQRNIGYGAAIKTGIKNAEEEIIVLFDGDGQHDPKDIERLVREINSCDVVIGARARGSHIDLFRRPTKWLLSIFSNFITEYKIPDINSGLRALRKKEILKMLHLLPNGFSFSTTSTIAALKVGLNVTFIPIKGYKRKGKSSVDPIKDGIKTIMLIIRLVTLFSPLRIFLPMSILIIGIGILYQIINIIQYGMHMVEGAILAILVGVFTFFFGILADQIAAMRREKYE